MLIGVFFQLEPKRQNMRVITNCMKNIGNVDLINLSKSTRTDNEIFVQINKFDQLTFLIHDVCDFGLALNSEKVKKEYFQSEKTIVDGAMRQIIKGAYGTIIEHITRQVVSCEGYSNTPDIFIPIIVTNAKLFLCKFDPKDIDPELGHITKDPDYVTKDVLIYEYPTPKEVQFPEPLSSSSGSEHRKHILKWQVLVMSPKGFIEFLNAIDNVQKGNT